MAKESSEEESRARKATKIINEYEKKDNSNRENTEREVQRIANPMGTSDHEPDHEEYAQ